MIPMIASLFEREEKFTAALHSVLRVVAGSGVRTHGLCFSRRFSAEGGDIHA